MKLDRTVFKTGMRDGFPIGLGYLAVSFSLGIAAREVGMTPLQGFLASLFTIASAGEYAGIQAMAEQVPYLMAALAVFIANARYLLMSCSLSQKFSKETTLPRRISVGFFLTDEIFGITIGRGGYVEPSYVYGAALACVPLWAIGTALGIICGNVLPVNIVSALSVALYAMFIAIIIPPAKKDKTIAILIVISFAASYICSRASIFSGISSGTVMIILTIIISAIAALVAPRKEAES